MAKISDQFLHNCLKANAKKCHLFLSPFVDKAVNVENFTIRSSYAEVLLRVTIGSSNLSLTEHMTYLCATVKRKLHAFPCVVMCFQIINLKRRFILMQSLIIPQFSYCSLIWMTHSRRLNNKINHIHERTLRIVYRGFSPPFQGLLAKDKSIAIHNRNLQQLAIEIFKGTEAIQRNILVKNSNTMFFYNNLYIHFLRSCCENVFKIVCIGSEKIGKLISQFHTLFLPWTRSCLQFQ